MLAKYSLKVKIKLVEYFKLKDDKGELTTKK